MDSRFVLNVRRFAVLPASGNQEFVTIALTRIRSTSCGGAYRQFIGEFGGHILVITVDAEAPTSIKKWRIDELPI